MRVIVLAAAIFGAVATPVGLFLVVGVGHGGPLEGTVWGAIAYGAAYPGILVLDCLALLGVNLQKGDLLWVPMSGALAYALLAVVLCASFGLGRPKRSPTD